MVTQQQWVIQFICKNLAALIAMLCCCKDQQPPCPPVAVGRRQKSNLPVEVQEACSPTQLNLSGSLQQLSIYGGYEIIG